MRRQKRNEDDAAIDMTPMLDIVFIMLIFFIVTASFLKESGINVNRPEGDNSQQDQPDMQNIMILVTADNEVWMQSRQIDIRAVRANVERLKAENPEGSIVIQADENSHIDTVAQIMDSLNTAGFSDHVLATAN